MVRSCFSSKPNPHCNKLSYTMIWFNDPSASDFFAVNSKNPFCPSPADIWSHNNALCSSAKVSNSEGALLSSSPSPHPSFLLSYVIILFFPHLLRYQSQPDSVNSVIKSPSLDLAVHGINPSIESHQKSPKYKSQLPFQLLHVPHSMLPCPQEEL